MSRVSAAVALVVVCMIIAVLLLRAVIAPVAASASFAVALAVLGVASGGFRRAAGR